MASKKELMRSNVSCILSRPGTVPVAEDREPIEEPRRFEARGRPRSGQKKGWEGKTSYTTSFVFDREQYEAMEAIAFKEGVSKKVAVMKLLEIGMREYHKNGLLSKTR